MTLLTWCRCGGDAQGSSPRSACCGANRLRFPRQGNLSFLHILCSGLGLRLRSPELAVALGVLWKFGIVSWRVAASNEAICCRNSTNRSYGAFVTKVPSLSGAWKAKAVFNEIIHTPAPRVSSRR